MRITLQAGLLVGEQNGMTFSYAIPRRLEDDLMDILNALQWSFESGYMPEQRCHQLSQLVLYATWCGMPLVGFGHDNI